MFELETRCRACLQPVAPGREGASICDRCRTRTSRPFIRIHPRPRRPRRSELRAAEARVTAAGAAGCGGDPYSLPRGGAGRPIIAPADAVAAAVARRRPRCSQGGVGTCGAGQGGGSLCDAHKGWGPTNAAATLDVGVRTRTRALGVGGRRSGRGCHLGGALGPPGAGAGPTLLGGEGMVDPRPSGRSWGRSAGYLTARGAGPGRPTGGLLRRRGGWGSGDGRGQPGRCSRRAHNGPRRGRGRGRPTGGPLRRRGGRGSGGGRGQPGRCSRCARSGWRHGSARGRPAGAPPRRRGGRRSGGGRGRRPGRSCGTSWGGAPGAAARARARPSAGRGSPIRDRQGVPGVSGRRPPLDRSEDRGWTISDDPRDGPGSDSHQPHEGQGDEELHHEVSERGEHGSLRIPDVPPAADSPRRRNPPAPARWISPAPGRYCYGGCCTVMTGEMP